MDNLDLNENMVMPLVIFLLMLMFLALTVSIVENNQLEDDISDTFMNPIRSKPRTSTEIDNDDHYLCYHAMEY